MALNPGPPGTPQNFAALSTRPGANRGSGYGPKYLPGFYSGLGNNNFSGTNSGSGYGPQYMPGFYSALGAPGQGQVSPGANPGAGYGPKYMPGFYSTLGAQPPPGLNWWGQQPQFGKGGKGAKGGKGGQQKQPSPFDPEYYANVAQYMFKTNNAIASAEQAQAEDRTALSGALAQLQYQQPHDALALEQQANRNGALYSSPYAGNLGQLAYRYAGKQAGYTNSYGGRLAGLASQIAGLQGSIPLYENQQATASAIRLSQAAGKNKALGERSGPLVASRSVLRGRGGHLDRLKSTLAGGKHGR